MKKLLLTFLTIGLLGSSTTSLVVACGLVSTSVVSLGSSRSTTQNIINRIKAAKLTKLELPFNLTNLTIKSVPAKAVIMSALKAKITNLTTDELNTLNFAGVSSPTLIHGLKVKVAITSKRDGSKSSVTNLNMEVISLTSQEVSRRLKNTNVLLPTDTKQADIDTAIISHIKANNQNVFFTNNPYQLSANQPSLTPGTVTIVPVDIKATAGGPTVQKNFQVTLNSNPGTKIAHKIKNTTFDIAPNLNGDTSRPETKAALLKTLQYKNQALTADDLTKINIANPPTLVAGTQTTITLNLGSDVPQVTKTVQVTLSSSTATTIENKIINKSLVLSSTTSNSTADPATITTIRNQLLLLNPTLKFAEVEVISFASVTLESDNFNSVTTTITTPGVTPVNLTLEIALQANVAKHITDDIANKNITLPFASNLLVYDLKTHAAILQRLIDLNPRLKDIKDVTNYFQLENKTLSSNSETYTSVDLTINVGHDTSVITLNVNLHSGTSSDILNILKTKIITVTGDLNPIVANVQTTTAIKSALYAANEATGLTAVMLAVIQLHTVTLAINKQTTVNITINYNFVPINTQLFVIWNKS